MITVNQNQEKTLSYYVHRAFIGRSLNVMYWA